jgi:hypothetical protein
LGNEIFGFGKERISAWNIPAKKEKTQVGLIFPDIFAR